MISIGKTTPMTMMKIAGLRAEPEPENGKADPGDRRDRAQHLHRHGQRGVDRPPHRHRETSYNPRNAADREAPQEALQAPKRIAPKISDMMSCQATWIIAEGDGKK